MQDYSKLVQALRACARGVRRCDECYQDKDRFDCHTDLMHDAAAAIEALQAELEKKRAADCWGCKCEKVEPKRGEWVGVNPMVDSVQCSICGGQLFSAELETPYCPYCGARMEVQE